MPTSENAILYYEAGQTPAGWVALTDQGDFLDFKSASNLWSRVSGKEPNVKPNGLATGGAVSPAVSGTNNLVDVAALTCYLAGILTSVSSSTDETITRASTDTHIKNSITINSSGAIAIVAGSEGTSFSTSRGANGGPPWIPTGSIEIAQVWLDSQTDAAIETDEIYQVQGESQERYDYPTWDVETADVESGVLGYAGVKFHTALQAIHSDDAGSTVAGKKVYVNYYVPVFAQLPKVSDFESPEDSHSITSTQIYGMTLAASSSSLNQGSFVAYLEDGITDPILAVKNLFLWFKFKQDRLRDPYILCQGKLGIAPSFPSGDNVASNCTISAEQAAVRVNG